MQNQQFAASGIVLSTFILMASICCCVAANTQGGAEAVWPTKEWQTTAPEEQGMDSAALARLLDFGTTRSLDSLLISVAMN